MKALADMPAPPHQTNPALVGALRNGKIPNMEISDLKVNSSWVKTMYVMNMDCFCWRKTILLEDSESRSCFEILDVCYLFWFGLCICITSLLSYISFTRLQAFGSDQIIWQVSLNRTIPIRPVELTPLSCKNIPSFVNVRIPKTGSTTIAIELHRITNFCGFHGTNGQIDHYNQCSNYTEEYKFHPDLNQHVPYFSCIENVLDNPVKLITFRNPTTHMKSLWKYGFNYGLRKGYVFRNWLCNEEPSFEQWLLKCGHAADNMYLQMLEPNEMNISIALQNLRKNFVVGIFEDFNISYQILEHILQVKLNPLQNRNKNWKKTDLAATWNEILSMRGERLLDLYTSQNWVLYNEALRIHEIQAMHFGLIPNYS